MKFFFINIIFPVILWYITWKIDERLEKKRQKEIEDFLKGTNE